MGYPMSDEERDIQARARELMDTEFIPFEVEAEMNGGELPEDVIERQHKAANEAGFHAINQPKELGGAGFTMFQQVLVQEQVGRVTNGLAWIVDTPAGWFPEVATPDQIERYVKPTDPRRAARVLRDHGGERRLGRRRHPGHRPARRRRVRAERRQVARHVVQRRRLHLLPGAPDRGTERRATRRCSSSTWTRPGISVRPRPRGTATRCGSTTPRCEFTDVRVPAANLVGAEDDGMAYAYAWFRYERLMIGARCCGAAERLIDEATAFARERVQFGRPIYENQAIQFMLADSLTELWAARLMLYETARGIDRGEDLKVQHGHCSMVKLFASEMANRVADRAVQIFGGRGYMRENAAERFFRELRVERIWEGTSEIQRAILADQLAKRGASALAG